MKEQEEHLVEIKDQDQDQVVEEDIIVDLVLEESIKWIHYLNI